MVGEDKHGSLWNHKKRTEFTYHLGGMDNLESPQQVCVLWDQSQHGSGTNSAQRRTWTLDDGRCVRAVPPDGPPPRIVCVVCIGPCCCYVGVNVT
jgi:hypothetical protein